MQPIERVATANKKHENEIIRATLNALSRFDNDATSCYDLANLCSRRLGQNKHVCLVQGQTLEEARYHLKTQKGISETFVQHCTLYPWHGTGQGSGNSPVYWLVICDVLFNCYDELAHGATFETPDKSRTITLTNNKEKTQHKQHTYIIHRPRSLYLKSFHGQCDSD